LVIELHSAGSQRKLSVEVILIDEQ
jgi:hypothetical protein